MMETFIKFFTKEKMSVLDPFMGIGSTLVGCKRTDRIGYGIELNKKYFDITIKRVPEFKRNVYNDDARNVKEIFHDKKFNFAFHHSLLGCINRSTNNFRKLELEEVRC